MYSENGRVVRDNKIEMSLMRFYVVIEPIVEYSDLHYKLNVYKDCNNKRSYYFDNLEKAIDFIMNDVKTSLTFEDIDNKYNELSNRLILSK